MVDVGEEYRLHHYIYECWTVKRNSTTIFLLEATPLFKTKKTPSEIDTPPERMLQV